MSVVDYLIINYSDSTGSGQFALKIAKQLLCLGYNVEVFVLEKKSNLDYVIESKKKESRIHKLKRKFENKIKYFNPKYDFHNRGYFVIDRVKDFEISYKKKPENIIAVWTSIFISPDVLVAIKNKYNFNLYIHPPDKQYFFGGCHYNVECFNYLIGCSKCPAVPVFLRKLPKKNFLKNLKLSQNATLILHLPWLVNYVKNLSHLKYSDIKFFASEFDRENLIPVNKEREKNLLGISGGINVLFACTNINDPRKGFSYLKNVLDLLSKRTFKNEVRIITIGDGELNLKSIVFKHIHFRFISDTKHLIAIYKATDIILSLSLDDFGPGVLLEAMLCGNIPISFDVGFANDIIQSDETGFIVDNYNCIQIANRLEYLINLSFANRLEILQKMINKTNSYFNLVKEITNFP
jgi:glycosyltransferase involved in cell wall biosynthesis